MTGDEAGDVAGVRSRSYSVGLLGQGIGPSLSPELHEREGARQGLRYVYKRVELQDAQLDAGALGGLLAHAVHLGFDGLNVTHPVKQVMAALVDELAPEAEAIGAINTAVIQDGRTRGHNTDITGFRAAFQDQLGGAPLDRVVLVGAGGAGAAVGHALVGLGVDQLTVVDRDTTRAQQLVDALPSGGRPHAAEVAVPERLPELLGAASGMVNATPMGMAAHPGSPVPADLLRPELWVADIVYRPLVTQLVRDATAHGCRVMTGAGMAVNQAADAFALFTGRVPDRTAMFTDFDALVADERADDVDRP